MNEINSICRLCLTSGVNLTSIFNASDNLAHKIHSVTGVMIVELKNHSSNAQICEECHQKLSSAVAFRREVIKADEHFKKLFNENEIWQKQLEDLVEVKYEETLVIKAEPLEDDSSSFAVDPGDDFYEEKSFEAIKKTKPKHPKRYDCPHCDEKLKCSLTLRNHILQIHRDCGFSCDYCGGNYPLKTALALHLRKKHRFQVSRKESFKCPTCFDNFCSPEDLQSHALQFHKIEKDIFACLECGKFYSTRKKVKRHIKDSHRNQPNQKAPIKSPREVVRKMNTEDQTFICPVCAKIFKKKSNLAQHEKTHRLVKPSEYFFCDLCGNKFKEKHLMVIHIKNRHIKKIRFQCSFCPKNYATNYHLSIHTKVIHLNIRDFKCQYCPKTFGEKKKLLSHERTHTGETPYECRFCGRKFIHQTDYRRHVWGHTGHKSFRCQHCDQGYMKRAELENHMQRCRAIVQY